MKNISIFSFYNFIQFNTSDSVLLYYFEKLLRILYEYSYAI